MPYVAVKGGEQAILNAEALLKAKRRVDPGGAGVVSGANPSSKCSWR